MRENELFWRFWQMALHDFISARIFMSLLSASEQLWDPEVMLPTS